MNADPQLHPPALADAGGLVLAPPTRTPLRVLCVDDNRDAADSLGALLRLVGFDARVCHDAATALSVATGFRPEACVLDISMPVTDGYELGRILRNRPGGKELYLVALTALSDDRASARIADAGFDRHLVKPVNPQVLIDTLFTIERTRGSGNN